MTYQSRFGCESWLTPDTAIILQKLANSGIKDVQLLLCPGFSVDCLETLEEIGRQNKK